jgi:hypothetical protein
MREDGQQVGVKDEVIFICFCAKDVPFPARLDLPREASGKPTLG